ncbi:MAG: hypothetical protein GY711_04030 [bacterium]|nr:hypothetical protein [bacterium]
MHRTLFLAATLSLAAGTAAAEPEDEYTRLVAGFEQSVAEYRGEEAVVAPLLPDESPFHAQFLEAAGKHDDDKALPYLGWVLQNAPRNLKAHGAAVSAIEAIAKTRAEAVASERQLYQRSRKAVKHLKYNRVDDTVFAQTLLGAVTLARHAKSEDIRVASERSVFKLTRLQVGMVAPDIAGTDLDGVEFKLSDYRDKIVVVDFWGDW